MEQYFVFLAVIFSIISPITSESNEWIKGRFPNPQKPKNTCGRIRRVISFICNPYGTCVYVAPGRRVFSWICDPDAILSNEDANVLEEMLQSVSLKTKSGCSINSERPGYQIGVAVMKKMAVPSERSKEDVAQDFAKHLHNKWGVGSSGCDDGVLLLLSVEDRQIFISTGRTAKKQLSDDQISLIIDKMKTPLRGKQYGRALHLGVENMHQIFDDKGLEYNYLFYALLLFLAFLAICFIYRDFLSKLVFRMLEYLPDPGSSLTSPRFDPMRYHVIPNWTESHNPGASFSSGSSSLGSGSSFGGGGCSGGGGRRGSW